MKALTLTCPWAHAVAYWGKAIENRTWSPPRDLIGQRLAIHAGKSPYRQRKDGSWTANDGALNDMGDVLAFCRNASGLPLLPPDVTNRWVHETSSAVLCVATVAGYVRAHGGELVEHRSVNMQRAMVAAHSRWFVGPYGWVLADVVTMLEPVPCHGAQGLWSLPDAVEVAVRSQMPAGA